MCRISPSDAPGAGGISEAVARRQRQRQRQERGMRRGGRCSREHSNTRTLAFGRPRSLSERPRRAHTRVGRRLRVHGCGAGAVPERRGACLNLQSPRPRKYAHGQVSCRLADWIVQIRLEAPTLAATAQSSAKSSQLREAGRQAGQRHAWLPASNRSCSCMCSLHVHLNRRNAQCTPAQQSAMQQLLNLPCLSPVGQISHILKSS